MFQNKTDAHAAARAWDLCEAEQTKSQRQLQLEELQAQLQASKAKRSLAKVK